MQSFFDEIYQQPQALNDLLSYYKHYDLAPVQAQFQGENTLLVGMGASYHAAQIAAYRRQQVDSSLRAWEAADILFYQPALLSNNRLLVYISQSGSSAEIEPIFAQLPSNAVTIGITNNPESLLGQRSGRVLPLCAGEEYTVATKTYLNTLALLSLLGGVDSNELHRLIDRIAALLDAADAIRTLWLDTLADAQSLYFLGHGPHAITARHCAMMAGEWAKRSVAHASIGAFRHGYIEAVEKGMGIVIFAPPSTSQISAHALAQELAGYGASVLVVENGHTRRVSDVPPQADNEDPYLAPLLDVIPAQLFAEALARHEQIPPGFRYISKVITKL